MKQINRYFILILAFVLFISFPAAATEESGAGLTETEVNEALVRIERLKILKLTDSFNADEPSSTVTREELANLAANMLGISLESSVIDMQPELIDINSSRYKSQIQILVKAGIMSGINPYQFKPKQTVRYQEAVKVLVAALGYQTQAESNGGYPSGYLYLSKKLKIALNNLNYDKEITWSELSEMVTKCFDVPIQKIVAMGEYLEYSKEKDVTFLSEFHDVNKIRGVITDNGFTTRTGKSAVGVKNVVIDGVTIGKGTTDIETAFGVSVTCWYKEESGVRTALFYDVDKNHEPLLIFADDVISAEKTSISYLEDERIKTIAISSTADVIYNGASYPDFDGSIFNLDNGKLTLLDTKAYESGYDLVIIEEFESCFLSSIDSEGLKLYGYYGESYDLNEYDAYRLLDDSGKETALASVAANSVASVYKSKNKELIRIVFSTKTVSGTFSAVNSDNKTRYTIAANDEQMSGEYDLSEAFKRKLENKLLDMIIPELGGSYTFYLDIEDNIAGVLGEHIVEQYAFLTGVTKKQDGLSDGFGYARLYVTDGGFITARTAKNITVNKAMTKIKGEEIVNIADLYDENGDFLPQLVKVEMKDGNITAIETSAGAVANAYGFDGERFSMDYMSPNAYWRSGNKTMGSYAILPDAPIFLVPKSMSEDLFEVIKTSGISSDTSRRYDVKLYDLDTSLSAKAAVIYTKEDAPAYETCMFVVEKATCVVNSDGEIVTRIKGYQNKTYREYEEKHAGILSAAAPEGIKAGDVLRIALQSGGSVFQRPVVFDSKIIAAEKIISLDAISEGGFQSFGSGSSTDNMVYYGPIYGKSAAGISILTDAAAKKLNAVQPYSDTTYLIYDTEVKKIKIATYDEICSASVVYADGTIDADWNNLLFAQRGSGYLRLAVLIKR